jgi:hypothetical protein
MAKTKEKDYAKIAAEAMYRPADRQRSPRFLIYSRNKKGKTYFSLSAGIGKTLVIDPEKGADEMKRKNPHVWPVRKWGDIDEVYEFVRHVNKCPFKGCEFGEGHPFDWISVDGLTKMNNMALKHVMKLMEERSLDRIPGMVNQKDYGKSGELMKEMMNKFHYLPQGIVFTAQERQMEAYDSEEDEDYEDNSAWYVPDVPKAVKGAANSIVDVIGRLYVVRIESDTDKPKAERRLWVGDSAKYDTGYRSDFVLPDTIRSPTIPKLVSLMRTGTIPQPTKKTKKKK